MTTAIMQQRSDEARLRANLSRLFGGFFREPPSEELTARLERERPFGDDVRVGAPIDDLRVEFDGLFRVPASQYVYPFESCYRTRSNGRPGPLAGRAAHEANEAYLEAGFEPRLGPGEYPDHVGVQLAFLELLSERECEALAAGDVYQADRWSERHARFLDAHLRGWIGDLCREIEENATLDYYRQLAQWIPEALQEHPFQSACDCGAAAEGVMPGRSKAK